MIDNRIKLLRIMRILSFPILILMIVALYAVFVYSEVEAVMGVIQKIFYFHVSAWWVAFLGLMGAFVFSALYLLRRHRTWDIIASSSAEISFVYLTIGITTGPVWARLAWGTWWTWEPRLTTALVLWLIFAGYMSLRSAIREEERKGVLSAVLAIFGFVDVPIVFMSIRWWRTIHPVIMDSKGMYMTPSMKVAFFISLGVFTLIFLYMISYRVLLEMLSDEVGYLKVKMREKIGQGV